MKSKLAAPAPQKEKGKAFPASFSICLTRAAMSRGRGAFRLRPPGSGGSAAAPPPALTAPGSALAVPGDTSGGVPEGGR